MAVTRVNYEELFTDTFANANESGSVNQTKAGWVGGFGIGYHLPAQRWSVKGEYLYSDFGRITMLSNNLTSDLPPFAFPSSVFTHTMALHTHIMRLGVDYRW